jgi:hypothetical protein
LLFPERFINSVSKIDLRFESMEEKVHQRK